MHVYLVKPARYGQRPGVLLLAPAAAADAAAGRRRRRRLLRGEGRGQHLDGGDAARRRTHHELGVTSNRESDWSE